MRLLLSVFLLTLVALILWTALVVKGTFDGWWRHPLAPIGDTRAFMQAVIEEIDANFNGNVAFTLIEDGQIAGEYFTSAGAEVDQDTLFQVASMSKWISAWGVMRLVEEGKLDLDAPISTYLTRWQLPETGFNNNEVTVRRLLSHTADLTDGLGYLGFEPGTKIQSIEEALDEPNATRGPGVKIQVGIKPGSEFKYSGGGYLILQLLIEEVSGQTFESFMQSTVFLPLGMTRSSYSVPAQNLPNLAVSYHVDGTPALLYNFTAVSAASLYTTTADMTRFIQAHLADSAGRPAISGALGTDTLKDMRQPHGYVMGLAIWGLGTILYSPDGEGNYVFGHDGKNDPAINTTARINPATGDGFIILQTGNDLLATRLGSEWVFWQTSKIDLLTLNSAIDGMMKIIIPGWIVILLGGVLIGWRRHRRQKKFA